MTSPTRETVEEAKAKATEFSEAGHRVPARFVQTLLTALQAREEEIESLEQTCSALHSTGEEICGRNTAIQSALAEALVELGLMIDVSLGQSARMAEWGKTSHELDYARERAVLVFRRLSPGEAA